MTVSSSAIAKRHFLAALAEAREAGADVDAVARHTLALVISAFLERRSVADVRQELIAAGENVDPDTDYMFMRP
jgi:hypothetical protein